MYRYIWASEHVCVTDYMCGVYMECWGNVCVCEEVYICGCGGLHVYGHVSVLMGG